MITSNINENVKRVCPLCGKPLTSEEYNRIVKSDIMTKENYEKEIEEFKQIHNQQLHDKEKELREQSKMHQNEISRFTETINEKDKTLKVQEIQLQRVKKNLEEMKNKVTPKQSELIGEAGERNLLEILKEAFPQDVIERTKRGTEDGDIIHSIRTQDGILETKIVYDNKSKSSSTIGKEDREKAKKYKKIHNTRYVFIVSSNLPPEIKNGRIGQIEGITLIHLSIIVEVVKIVREGIIIISNSVKSEEEKESIKANLYKFITSEEFLGLIEENEFIYDSIMKRKEKDKEYHIKMWEKEEKELKKFKENMDFVTQKFKRITAGNLIMIQQ